ncbi:MAG: DEAD/DEAH box helicase [Muribaculaceae bacterium]|nr:DEAD/DEAH box helicase [Muribaculaceae bacterium]
MKFEDILSNDDLLDAVYDMHFDACTPIQEKAIPPALEGKDILAVAQTGTGKTAAYLLPVIERLINDNYPQDRVNCVVMAPTRELAQQIDRQLQGFSYYLPVSSMAIYGGTDGATYDQQRKGLKSGADIVIATPGRLLTHLNMGYVDLSEVSFFILDEADRMLDMGFLDDIMKIISHLPKDRQTMLFSATMPDNIKKLAENVLSDPVDIRLAVSKPADKIKQEAYVVFENQKIDLLQELFRQSPPEKVIVFSGSKAKVKDLYKSLRNQKYKVAEMHSDLEQKERDEVMYAFKAGKVNVIVATDILSRGIDIDNIETVVNYDVPHDGEDYVHRIGRTARADKTGTGITFISDKEIGKFKRIERLLGKEVEKMELPEGFEKGPEYVLPKNGRKGRNRGFNDSKRGKGLKGGLKENKEGKKENKRGKKEKVKKDFKRDKGAGGVKD